VTGAMVVTTLMAFEFVRVKWKWPQTFAICILAPLLALELVFLGANLLKVHDGGWVPVLMAIIFTIVMWTWKRGTAILFEKTRRIDVPLETFIPMVERRAIMRRSPCPASAIFLTSDPETAPAALLHNIKHNHVLHEKNVVLTIITVNKPRVSLEERFKIEKVSERFTLIELRFGFMQSHNVSQALGSICARRASSSTSCRPPSIWAAASWCPMPRPACPCGRTACSSPWPTPRPTRPTISTCRPTASSNSARMSSSEMRRWHGPSLTLM
jgi:K+ transporter